MLKTKKIKIGYRTYVLRNNTKVLEELSLCGRHKSCDQIIEYSSDYPPSELVDTILHEILHACWSIYVTEGTAKEEGIITSLAHGITQVMKDNPKLMKELQELL